MKNYFLSLSRKFILLFIMLCFYLSSEAVAPYKTRVIDDAVKSLQLRVNDNWRNPPVIRLGSDDVLVVDFDILTGELPMLYYMVEHCNADWTQSSLSSSEYMRGFNKIEIDDFATSYNTLTDYVHYKIPIPNDKFQPSVSGNYVIKVFDYDYPEEPLATACFSVTEDLSRVEGFVSGITLKDYKKANQQLKVKVIPDKISVRNPQSELKLVIQQNSRCDNEQVITTPLFVGYNEIVYENSPKLIFPGGNQFRRFEMITHTYSGMGIESVYFHEPYYNVDLQPDQVRANKSYRFDEDQYGKYIVRALDVTDSATEADYFLTHFFLNMDDPLINGRIYLFGELSNFRIDDHFAMAYDATLGGYTHSHLLKEGHYNFIYLYVPNGSQIGETGLVEGNFYETRNEYLIKIYYRSIGDRYDRLIASQVLY